MDSAFAWIGQIIEWVGQFIPRAFVFDVTTGCVKFRLGSEISELKPGKVHLYWPFTTIIKTFPIARQTIDLTAQTFEAKCGKQVLASGMVAYSVNNVIALLTETFDPDNTIRDIAMSAIQDVLTQYTWEELRNGLGNKTLKKELQREVQRELRSYGVKVHAVGIKDLVGTQVFKVALEQSVDGAN